MADGAVVIQPNLPLPQPPAKIPGVAGQFEGLPGPEAGLSGSSVRGIAENAPDVGKDFEASAINELADLAHQASDMILQAWDFTSSHITQAVDNASDRAFEAAAQAGVAMGTPAEPPPIGQPTFSWSGYVEALGILCLLLAAFWFGAWLLKRYGKFNFMPRPGALPKDALTMEAQMPLGPRKGLMVVRFMNRKLLLGVTDQSISLLTEEKAQNDEQATDFEGVMDNARHGHSGSGGTAA